MRCKAAVVHGVGQDWSVEEIEVDPPKAGEVLVKWTHAGLCHSDEHLLTGDFVPPPEAMEAMGIDTIFPMIGGHEGSGVVAEVGRVMGLFAGGRVELPLEQLRETDDRPSDHGGGHDECPDQPLPTHKEEGNEPVGLSTWWHRFLPCPACWPSSPTASCRYVCAWDTAASASQSPALPEGRPCAGP